ncbi:hypothetical protein E2C01_052679 [Portunus trituberculatus]|uniref:Uncharacterized protein n=1 Tax=Portunus trituberculatus TaxID=210409 RepID=A0A5B7GIB6_PORTR|nr:hypothetical protein [Portunus trituberculatus]
MPNFQSTVPVFVEEQSCAKRRAGVSVGYRT